MTEGRYTFANPLEMDGLGIYEVLRGRRDGVLVEPPGLPRRYERRPPLFHDDPGGIGLFPHLDAVSVTYPPAFILSLRGARLTGDRTLLTGDGRFTHDEGHLSEAETEGYLSKLAMTDPSLNEHTGMVRVAGRDFAVRREERPQVTLRGTVIVLASLEPGNYGSFVFRVLPKLVTAPRWGSDVRFLVWADFPAMQEMLGLFGVPQDRIILHDRMADYTIEHAIVPCLRNPHALLDDESRRLLGKVGARFAPGRRDRRIYVARQAFGAASQHRRAMLNEGDLIEALRALDIETVEPQFLSAREQIATFASASLVVGPAGSGMFNTAFCAPGTRVVDIESEPHWIHAHMCFLGSCGLRYGIFVGEKVEPSDASPHQPFRVDIPAILRRVAELISADDPG